MRAAAPGTESVPWQTGSRKRAAPGLPAFEIRTRSQSDNVQFSLLIPSMEIDASSKEPSVLRQLAVSSTPSVDG